MQFRDEHQNGEVGRSIVKNDNNNSHKSIMSFIQDSNKEDYMGSFCVTAGFGTDELARSYEAEHEDYDAIMVKAIADRLAEALAEYLHQEVRRQFWGYASDEQLDNSDLVKEGYKGIRPAPGYPACPDHTEKQKIWDLLNVELQTSI